MAREEEWWEDLTGSVDEVLKEADEGPLPGRGGGGGKKGTKKGERHFGHGKKAHEKRHEVEVGHAIESRAEEKELLLNKHLRKVVRNTKEAEAYLNWLVQVLGDSKFVLDEKEVKLSEAAPGGAGGSGKDTSNSACRARHLVTTEDSRLQENRSNNREAAKEILRERVKVWADVWRGYEEEMGEDATLALFDKATGYQAEGSS